MDAIECLKTRRSIRSYEDKPVSREIISDIVDCGRMAASAINLQPWQFVAVTERTTLRKLAQICDHGKFLETAAACVAVFCQNVKYYIEDGAAATQNMLNAARAYDLGSCWIAGDKKLYADDVRVLLGLPDDFRLISIVALGHPAESRESRKKPLESVLNWERYSGPEA
jgi:nitroreductase